MIEVLSVASEAYPLIKTGGLADVVGALPGALTPHGVSTRTLLPGYPAVMGHVEGGSIVAQFADLYGGPARLHVGRFGGLDLFVIDAPHLYDRPGNPYVNPEGWDWPDNWRRFAALSWVASRLGQGLVEGYNPQILHAHDWQAGLVPAYVKFGPSSQLKSVITVHNISFPGIFGAEIFGHLNLPPHAFSVDGVEYFGGVGYLKAGLECAHYVTTVSPTYAREIRTPAFGMGFDTLLSGRASSVSGILNGIDSQVWDPAIDKALVQNYNSTTAHKRSINKQAVLERFGLMQNEAPLFCVISRLTGQKGMDLLIQCIAGLIDLGGNLCVLGSGEPHLEHGFREAAQRYQGRVSIVTGYDENLSHLMQGGADAILIPSRFEPCGLTQLYGLRYGCVPIVSRVGGLADTIIDANYAALEAGIATGIQFQSDSAYALYEAIRQAVLLYKDKKTWQRIQRHGMKADVSWDLSAERYANLYANLLGQKRNDNKNS